METLKKIAAIITEYRPEAHADAIVTKFLKGFPTDQGVYQPRVKLASMYVDQFPKNDLSRYYAEQYNVPIFDSIVEALTLGGNQLAVDGVLLIGEHGNYAWNEKEQQLYPRKYFLEQICGVLATSGRFVPIFNDKHLSYNWNDAIWMYNRTRQLNAPFMGGSILPLCWRNPWLEHPNGIPIREAMAIGYSGLDYYGFHALETLQCMIERREGGETGVSAVTCLEGEAVWDAAKDGAWSRELAEASCSAIENKPSGSIESKCPHPVVFLIEYKDGFKGTVLMLNGYVSDSAYAARIENDILATEFYLQKKPPFGHFSYLCLNLEEMFITGKETYPIERSLLTTGVLEAALDSRYKNHRRVETPYLNFAYSSYHSIPCRPRGPRPDGALKV